MKEDTFPLPENRIGSLPEVILFILMGEAARTFHNKGVDIYKEFIPKKKSRFAASHLVGTEKGPHVNKNMRGFVRNGLPNNRQSFLQCMVYILNHPLVKSVNDIINHIISNFKIRDFLFLQNGLLCQKFMPSTKQIRQGGQHIFLYDPILLNDFRTFILDPQNIEFVKKFVLDEHVRAIKDDQNKFFEFDGIFLHHLLHLYQSFKAFHAYLRDDKIIKTHDVMLPIFMQKSLWMVKLNIQVQNIIVFEMQNDKPVFTCPYFGKPIESLYNKKLPFTFLFKKEHIYEPIIFVNYVGVKVEKRSHVDFNPYISRLLSSTFHVRKHMQKSTTKSTLSISRRGRTKNQNYYYYFTIVG